MPNPHGQRPVERIVCSPVSARRGGMQPAFTGRASMFGPAAPLWPFLAQFGLGQLTARPLTGVCETYPVLTLIALGWLLPDATRTCGQRLPKYNPSRRATFSPHDWQLVCQRTSRALAALGCPLLAAHLAALAAQQPVRKPHQDSLDACLCLLAALLHATGAPSLILGQQASGWLTVPSSPALLAELTARLHALGLDPSLWLQLVT